MFNIHPQVKCAYVQPDKKVSLDGVDYFSTKCGLCKVGMVDNVHGIIVLCAFCRHRCTPNVFGNVLPLPIGDVRASH